MQRPPTARFSDVQAILAEFGWTHARTRGSHAIFVKGGERSITVPVHDQKVGRRYLDQIRERLGLDDLVE
ncbi:MAG: type II toxin-antitoxin system HicA family toxin [Chloroflexia bacterium]|nr:type II toxin-antitoxin system HicA family toxin [Chloroflexia bacterium]